MSTDRPPSPSRDAFTLLELLIVLAILVTAMAMVWPAIGRLLAKNELRSAARQVRAVLAKTRLEATESGSIRQFRYQPGTRRFQVTRAGQADDEPPARRGPTGPGSAPDSPGETLLGSGVRFESPESSALPPRPVPPEDAREQAWSEPILFFPNGRTSNARLRLGGRRELHTQLTLRGVTGSITIGEVQRGEGKP